MEIHRIECTNFKQIEYNVFNFDGHGLISVHGPIGSGKTTIGELVIFSLFGRVKDINNSELIRFGTKKCTIDCEVFSKGHVLQIHREITGTASTLSATCDGIDIQFTNKRDMQQQLENEYYDVSAEIIERLCIITVNGFSGITRMKHTERVNFLNRMFGFTYIADLVSEVGAIEKDYKRKQHDSEIRNEQLLTQKDRLLALDTSYDAKKMQDWEYERAEFTTALENKKKQLAEFDNGQKDKLTTIYNSLNDIKMQGTVIGNKIKQLQSGICPTCGQHFTASDMETLHKQRDILRDEYRNISESYNTNKTVYDETIKQLKSEQQTIEQNIQSLVTRISIENGKKRNSEKIAGEIVNIETDIDNNNQMVLESAHGSSMCDELCGLLQNEIRSDIIARIIPLLNNTLQSYLVDFHQPYTITFDELFDCHLTNNQLNTDIGINTLSTGQKKILDMAVTLSLIDVLMSGVKFNIFFLDELLVNIDFDNRDTVCKVIKNHIRDNQTIYIISHERLNENNFDGAIRVRTENGVSNYQSFEY